MYFRSGRAPGGATIRSWTALAILPLGLSSAACSGAGQSAEYTTDSADEALPVPRSKGPHSEVRKSRALPEPGTEVAARGEPTAPGPADTSVAPANESDSAPILYVDPAAGLDDDDGSSDAPFRTLKRALSVAPAGATIWLRDGTYGVESGETWSKKVPEGVSILAVHPGRVVLVGQPPCTGLDFSGAGRVTGIVFKGFSHAVSAWSGSVSIEDGTVDTGGGFDFSGSARVVVTRVTMSQLTSDGLHARGTAEVTLTDTSFEGTGAMGHCDSAPGVIADESARVHFTDVSLGDFAAGAIDARGAAEVDLVRGLMTNTGQAECNGAQIAVSGTADVSIYDATVRDGGGTGIAVQGAARLSMEGVFIGVHATAGVRALGGKLDIASSDIRAGSTGISLSFTSANDGCFIAKTLIKGNAIGVDLGGNASVKMRHSTIEDGDYGVYAPSASLVFADLGVSLDPGENTISGKRAALTLSGSYGYPRTFGAAGNEWNPGVQGADAEGKYPSKVVTGVQDGRNFHVADSSVSIQL
jgi:hypothetical protein